MRITLLDNGFYEVYDYKTHTSGLYNSDGTHHSGDLHLARITVLRLIESL